MKTDKYFYQIRVEGQIDRRWADWFDGMNLSYPTTEGRETILAGYVIDQSALHGLLNKIRDLNLPLLAVMRLPGADHSIEREQL